MASLLQLRPLQPYDLPRVLHIQAACYAPVLRESAATFTHKLGLWPDGCLGAWYNTTLAGYLFAHPWKVDDLVLLHKLVSTLPADADCLYLHDLAVDPVARRLGLARELLAVAADLASYAHLQRFALVSVQDSEAYWTRWGFRVRRRFDYAPGVPARYMVCDGPLVWEEHHERTL